MPVYYVNKSAKKSRSNNFFPKWSVTTYLIVLNIFFFVFFSLLFYFFNIPIDIIAIKPSNIIEGKYLWTFFTSIFMHGGFFHLFANMFSLFFIGSLLEKLIGYRRFIYFYIFSGLFAGLFFVLFSFFTGMDIDSYAVGASGAIFGLIGVLVLLTPNLPVFILFIPIPIKMKYAAPGLLFLLWLVSLLADIPVGNVAHLGGLVAGLLYGYYLRKKFPKKTAFISKYFS